MRLIDADALKVRRFRSKEFNCDTGSFDLPVVPWHDIEDAETLDYAPVRHGEWTLVEKFFPCGEEGEVDSDWYLVCSECGREVPVYEYWPPDIDIKKLTKDYPYCHCGAKMEVGKNDGKNSDA